MLQYWIIVSWLYTDLIGWLTCHTRVVIEQLNESLTPAVGGYIISSHPVLFHLLKPINMNPLIWRVICLYHIDKFFRYHTNGTHMFHILNLFVVTLVSCSFLLLLYSVLVFKNFFCLFFFFWCAIQARNKLLWNWKELKLFTLMWLL